MCVIGPQLRFIYQIHQNTYPLDHYGREILES